MAVPDWIWIVFIFALGCCVGSFLNVVIYRMPREKSLIKPASFCPECGKHIHFYDNIPLVSWMLLRAKCRYCKAPISVRYFIVELLTGLIFVCLFFMYFHTSLRAGFPSLGQGGWLIYVLHLVLLAAFIAASAIDLQLWIIPLSICWLVTGVGLIGSTVGQYVIDPSAIRLFSLLPVASASTAALTVGATLGLGISWLFLATGLLKRSYEGDVPDTVASENIKPVPDSSERPQEPEEHFNHRREVIKETLYLLPIVVFSLVVCWFMRRSDTACVWWGNFSQRPFVAGLLGSLFGYFIGCGVVWTTRILGTLAFRKEAMGLGDVHLMGAAGAVVGPVPVVVAFFIAPFFGLAWAIFQMFFRKTRQIPYGPFLSLGVFAVMILHDWIFAYWGFMLSR